MEAASPAETGTKRGQIEVAIGENEADLGDMPKIPTARRAPVAINNTVKLPLALRRRVVKAMAVEGFTVWSEFCRVALTEKCHQAEDQLRARDPMEFKRIYVPDPDRF
jgi:hypothetical protein